METTEEENKSGYIKTTPDGRERTNILRTAEHKAISFLVKRIPPWVTSNMLTGLGFVGNITVFAAFLMAEYIDETCLLIGIPGFMISWFGDSLDGRMAYYRHKPRKWYGFSLDLTIDWVGIILIGLGFMVYVEGIAKYLGFLFVALYGWEMMTALLRYKIVDKYSIDSGAFGPTEVRIIISAILLLEVLFRGSIIVFSSIASAVLLILNIIDSWKLLKSADQRDIDEHMEKRTEG
jgi:hypothetical protein